MSNEFAERREFSICFITCRCTPVSHDKDRAISSTYTSVHVCLLALNCFARDLDHVTPGSRRRYRYSTGCSNTLHRLSSNVELARVLTILCSRAALSSFFIRIIRSMPTTRPEIHYMNKHCHLLGSLNLITCKDRPWRGLLYIYCYYLFLRCKTYRIYIYLSIHTNIIQGFVFERLLNKRVNGSLSSVATGN